MVCSVMSAYAVSRYRIRGKTLIIGAMLYAYIFPPLLLAIPPFLIFARIGLADTLFSLAVAHTTIGLPLGVWLLWGFFKAMPFELEEIGYGGWLYAVGRLFKGCPSAFIAWFDFCCDLRFSSVLDRLHLCVDHGNK